MYCSENEPGAGLGRKPWVIPLWPFFLLQYLAHWKEGEVPQFTVHGLAGDPVPGPQTSRRPYPRQPGERAHLLLPVMPGVAVPP